MRAEIRVRHMRRESLRDLIDHPKYGQAEAIREGFPHLTGEQFVKMFVKHMKGDKNQTVTRIEFEHVD